MRGIPDGVYLDPAKVQSLTVTGSEIEFRLKCDSKYVAPEHLRDGMIDRTYSYTLTDKNELYMWGSSNDSAFLWVQMDWKWQFDGTNVVGNGVVFAPQATTSK